jgi:hypothetical protein
MKFLAGKLVEKYCSACRIVIDDFFLVILFDPEHGGDKVLRKKNGGNPRN